MMLTRLRRAVLPLVAIMLAVAALPAAPAAAQDLEQTLQRAAEAWHRGDANAIAGLGARAGISVDLDGRSVGPLGPRQAAAVIRRAFEDRESVGVRPNMSRGVGGNPPRAFGDVVWTTRVRGTTISERATIFFAFVREDDRWRITEIRLLR
jgi:hypothetical protein